MLESAKVPEQKKQNMKIFKMLAMIAAIGSSLIGNSLLADTNTTTTSPTPPVVVPSKPDFSKLPPEVRAMIKDFQSTRDSYQAKQLALLAQLKGSSAAQREAIREQLQANRQAFLDEVQAFRIEIKHELKEKHDAALDRWLDSHLGGKAHKGSNH